MKHLPWVIVLVLALAVGALGTNAASGAPSARAAKTKECRAPFTEARTAHQLRVTNVTCAKAQAIAQRVASRPPSGCVKFTDKQGHLTLVKPCARLGYRCTGRAIAQRLALSVTCASGVRVLRFQY
jgi:hypothetical protein